MLLCTNLWIIFLVFVYKKALCYEFASLVKYFTFTHCRLTSYQSFRKPLQSLVWTEWLRLACLRSQLMKISTATPTSFQLRRCQTNSATDLRMKSQQISQSLSMLLFRADRLCLWPTYANHSREHKFVFKLSILL